MNGRLCQRCKERPPHSPRAGLCAVCLGPKRIAELAAKRLDTVERQRRQPRPPRDARIVRAREQATVPLELLAARGDMMTRAEVAAVLGLSVNGVKLIEARALARVRQALLEAVA